MSTAINPPDKQRDVSNPPSGQRVVSPPVAAERRLDNKEIVRRQKERFGGMKFGACFFGWLTATGTAVLLTALLGAAGAAFGFSQNITTDQAAQNAQTIGLVGGIVLLVVVLLAYFCGGYVAGRMARFNGLKQGLGVWLWALVVAVVVAVLGLIAGSQFNVLSNLNGVPRIPVNEGTLSTGGIITAVAIVLVALIGALLGGLAGMRFHRRVDRADLTVDADRTRT
ncbi:MAG: hypothetical protein ACR2LI_11850 [Propionibacteriaceae bacterium]